MVEANVGGQSGKQWRARIFGWGGLALVTASGLADGIGGALLTAGLFGVVVSIVAFLRGGVAWAGVDRPAIAFGVLVASLAAVTLGTVIAPEPAPAGEVAVATVPESTPEVTPAPLASDVSSAPVTPPASPTPAIPTPVVVVQPTPAAVSLPSSVRTTAHARAVTPTREARVVARVTTARRVTATRTPAPTPTRTVTHRATPTPTRTHTAKPTPGVRAGVRPGAFCKPAGAYGRTVKGVLMQCKTSATDDRNRWRRA